MAANPTRSSWAAGLNPAYIVDTCSKQHIVSVLEQCVSYITGAEAERDTAAEVLRALLKVCDEELDPKRTPEMRAARVVLAKIDRGV